LTDLLARVFGKPGVLPPERLDLGIAQLLEVEATEAPGKVGFWRWAMSGPPLARG
jgi:hypothetical protein